MTYQTAPFVIT